METNKSTSTSQPYDYKGQREKIRKRVLDESNAKQKAREEEERKQKDFQNMKVNEEVEKFKVNLKIKKRKLLEALNNERTSFGVDPLQPNEGVVCFPFYIAENVIAILNDMIVAEPDLSYYIRIQTHILKNDGNGTISKELDETRSLLLFHAEHVTDFKEYNILFCYDESKK